MEVEDLDEADFEDKWPFTLDKKVEEPVKAPQPPQPEPTAAELQQQQQKAEKEAENEAKRKHDALMAKHHAEQRLVQE